MYKYAILTNEQKNQIREKTAKFISVRHTDGTISIPAELLVIPNFVKVDDAIAQQLASVWDNKNFCKTVSIIILDGICYVVAGGNRARAIEFMQSSPVVFCEVLGNTNTISDETPVFLCKDNVACIDDDDEIIRCFSKPGVARVVIPGRAGLFNNFFKSIGA